MKKVHRLITLRIWTAAIMSLFIDSLYAQNMLSDKELVSELQRGGYNIYFRHAATDWSQTDRVTAEGDWTSCDPTRMRQLSNEGRAVAQRIGAAIRRLDIPVGIILASEYCRTRQTAQLMDLGPVETTRMIMNMRVADLVGGPNAVIERARRVLATPPQAGTNTVLVAHGNLMLSATGVYGGEAGAGIFMPRPDGGVELVAQLAPEDWDRLAQSFSRVAH